MTEPMTNFDFFKQASETVFKGVLDMYGNKIGEEQKMKLLIIDNKNKAEEIAKLKAENELLIKKAPKPTDTDNDDLAADSFAAACSGQSTEDAWDDGDYPSYSHNELNRARQIADVLVDNKPVETVFHSESCKDPDCQDEACLPKQESNASLWGLMFAAVGAAIASEVLKEAPAVRVSDAEISGSSEYLHKTELAELTDQNPPDQQVLLAH